MYIFVETCFFSVMHGKQEITWDFFLRGSKQQDMFRKNYPFINSLCLAGVVDLTKQTTVEPVDCTHQTWFRKDNTHIPVIF